MNFNSITFFLFFALVMGLHSAPFPWAAKKINLLVASYIFYSAWNPPFVLVLMFSTVFDWVAARQIDKAQTQQTRNLFMAASVAANLGLLGFFKYGVFLLANLVAALAALGIDFHPAHPDIVLPIGISFYTFQSLSYTLGVYRRDLKPTPFLIDYALYVTFFPQLVSGPIVRANHFLPQLDLEARANATQIGWGLSLLVIGLFNKIVVADGILADLVDRLYHGQAVPNLLTAWCGTLAFAGQIFCDFSGYSSCAIGVAMCLGFALPDNFHFPYAAIGFSDFWRRWHISLSTWLRDYLYVSLGGNRRGNMRTYANLMATMLLGGLWHGASWTFAVWGGLHGAYLICERRLRRSEAQAAIWQSPLARLLIGLMTFALVCMAWVFFRADSFAQAFAIARAMIGLGGQQPTLVFSNRDLATGFVVVGTMLAIHWTLRNSTLEAVAERMAWPLRSAALATMIFLICTMPGGDRAFIYFQF